MTDLRARERLRQERATFEQSRRQTSLWFGLRLAMGYAGIVLLFGTAMVSTYILLNPGRYSATVTSVAASTLLVDMVSLAVSVFKLVLHRDSANTLKPITRERSH